jgi:hypothetical protein
VADGTDLETVSDGTARGAAEAGAAASTAATVAAASGTMNLDRLGIRFVFMFSILPNREIAQPSGMTLTDP